MTAFTERVADILQGNGIINQEDRELYVYGLQQGLFIILNVLTTVTIGIISNQIWESILFMFAYFPLRSSAGGYHAKSPIRCYLFSIIMIIAILESMKLPIWNDVNIFILVIVSSTAILFLAPVEDGNKPFDAKEIIVFKKQTKVVLCILVVMLLIFRLVELVEFSHCITLVLIMLSIMLVLGKIKNMSKREIHD